MLILSGKLGRTVALLAGQGWERRMTVSGSSKEETPRNGVRVRTSVPDGRKYVKSDELIRSDKVKKQRNRLRKIIEGNA